jgi:alkylation response protein AidB-like acyl-CoA dehydrogenase
VTAAESTDREAPDTTEPGAVTSMKLTDERKWRAHRSDLEAGDAAKAELRRWLSANWDPTLALRDWRGLLADSGWACPCWPRESMGRGLPPEMDAVVSEEIATAGAVGAATGAGMNLAAPTLLTHGSSDLKSRLLRPILTGEHHWCQLFSEPGSGSDLAGLTTKAVLDGDEWIVSGQKVWTTSALIADYGMLIARTNWDAPKHEGITYFALPMKQPGVVARPLRQMNGFASFNEVFLTDARIPTTHVIGEIHQGWSVALTTLAHERRLGSIRRPSFRGCGRTMREARTEAENDFKTYAWYPQRAGRVDLLIERARAAGRDQEPVVRQEIAALLSMQKIAEWTAARAMATRTFGRPPGPEGSLAKLSASNIAGAAARVHSMIGGASAMLAQGDAPLGGIIAEVLVSVPGASIAGGTDEIQRNIIAERVLGLPREQAVDRDLPFRLVPRNVG